MSSARKVLDAFFDFVPIATRSRSGHLFGPPRRILQTAKILSRQKFGSQPREPVAKAAFRPKDALERIASASLSVQRSVPAT
jgi:hypothetical protein